MGDSRLHCDKGTRDYARTLSLEMEKGDKLTQVGRRDPHLIETCKTGLNDQVIHLQSIESEGDFSCSLDACEKEHVR
jgi:hypothetical protein